MPKCAAFRILMLAIPIYGQDLPPEVLLLARIKLHMAQVLDRLPNYTCQETIERSRRRAGGKRFELLDAMNLEVAVVEGKELFSWPGEKSFRERDLRDMVPHGAIGNGSFALHARSVFISGTPRIEFRAMEPFNGREAAKYFYEVPQFRSGFRIRIGDVVGISGYRGFFWAEKDSLDLLRLEVQAFDIPPHLPLKATDEALEYERVPIGDSTFLLPRSSEMTMEDLQGNISRNNIRFSRCRQYAGESTLSFDEAPVPLAETPVAKPPIVLPAGLELEVELTAPLRFGRNAIGDRIEGRVRRDVKRNREVLVPKGAILRGNVVILERRVAQRNTEFLMVALQWHEIAFDGRTGAVDLALMNGGIFNVPASLNRPEYLKGSDVSLSQGVPAHRDVFYVRKSNLELPRGAALFWQTRSGVQTP